MLQHASELGANAVVGVRYDATEVMQGVTEVLAYGTAVVVEPAAQAVAATSFPANDSTDQVGHRWLYAGLSHHRDHLSAMIRTVIHQVEHDLPQWSAERHAL